MAPTHFWHTDQAECDKVAPPRPLTQASHSPALTMASTSSLVMSPRNREIFSFSCLSFLYLGSSTFTVTPGTGRVKGPSLQSLSQSPWAKSQKGSEWPLMVVVTSYSGRDLLCAHKAFTVIIQEVSVISHTPWFPNF